MRKPYSLINVKGESIIVNAVNEFHALIIAGRLGDSGWFIEDELSPERYCYTQLKHIYNPQDKLIVKLFQYFKNYTNDQMYRAYLLLEELQNMLDINNHKDLINYVMKNY